MIAAAKVVLAVAAAYAVMMGLLFLLQARLVYFPAKGAYSTTPQTAGLAFEALKLRTDDGEQIAAWWIPAPSSTPARGTVLLLHGNAGNIAHRIDYAKMFYGMGYHTLLLEYRGYGESSGEPSEEGTYRDAWAGWIWLTVTRGIKASDIVIFGESLGGRTGDVAGGTAVAVSPDNAALADTRLGIYLYSRFGRQTVSVDTRALAEPHSL